MVTQNLRGNIARITQDGEITEASTAIDFADPKRPDPIGIAIADYDILRGFLIAELDRRYVHRCDAHDICRAKHTGGF